MSAGEPIGRRMGPTTASELESIGIDTVEKLCALGWEEAFVRWIEAYPERLNLNAATGLVAATLGVSYLALSAQEKARARALCDGLRSARRPRRR